MILFYSQDLSQSTALLKEDEYHHCCKVLRHKLGDEIWVTNGNGITAKAIIKDISKKTASLDLQEKILVPTKSGKITLAVAPPKNRVRWEWLIEKAVELGVDAIIPLQTQRTERSRLNMDRGHKIMRSAALQSKRDFHPKLEESISFVKLMQQKHGQIDKYLSHYQPTNSALISLKKQAQETIVLVGPERDFSDEEIATATANGFSMVNISQHRLRTETAAIAVVDQLKSLGY